MQELASQSLELVSRELVSTLETARGEIEDFVDGQSDPEALVRAASMLHLAAGALKIVELHGAALLAEEMEQTCLAIHEAGEDTGEEATEALTRAMVQLPAYLDRLMSGGSDVALVLLPLLNDLRTVRKQPLLSEGTLMLLNSGPFERLRANREPATARDYGQEVPALAQKLRPKFQSALLQWIRGEEAEPYLSQLVEVCDALEQTAESEPVRQLWAVTAGVLVALRTGEIEPSIPIKRLLGQADRELKRLIDSGERPFVNSPPVELLNSLLYYVARTRSDDARLAELRRTFGVETTMPDAEEIEKAREDLAGPSVRLMQTVAEAIKEDLGEVKDVLDIFVRTGMENVADLSPQLDMLKKIGDTLGVLGLEKAREKIQGEAGKLADIVTAETIDDPSVLEGIAASLLDIEDMLDRELVNAGRQESEEASSEDGDLESTQFRHVTEAVMRECIVNLARIKEAVVKVTEDADSASALDQVDPQLRGIVAGLLMLNRNRAVNVIERIGRNITTRLTPGGKGMDTSVIERLADAIVAIEYYMETIALGRSDPFYMLDNANRCLDFVEGQASGPGQRRGERQPAPEVAEPEAPGVAGEPAREVTETPEALSVMDARDERSEPELVEIFIEEAKEELANIRANLPRWLSRTEDRDALIAVRRSFHTLKGSGRMVGAQLLGEFAWSIENLLNRVINKTLGPEPAILSLVEEAAGILPALIEQLEVGIAPPQDVASLIARAGTLAEGGEPETAGSEPALATEAEAGPVMDPVLRQIFVKEVREHLAAIREFVDQAGSSPAGAGVTESLHRACHTLFGSARMADCRPAIELAEPLDRKVRHAFESDVRLAPGAVATLARFCVAIDELTAALEADGELRVDADLVAAIDALPLVGEPETSQRSDAEAARAMPPAPEHEEAAAGVSSVPGTEAVETAPSMAEYDPDIAGIFCDEAAELLDQAENQLQALRESADSDGPVAELKRQLHTLKGGARLAGIVAMGDLSHALETMLPKMAADSVAARSGGLELAQQALDCLQQMRDAVEAGHHVLPAGELVARLEAYGEGSGLVPEPESGVRVSTQEPEPEPEVEDDEVTRLQPIIDFNFEFGPPAGAEPETGRPEQEAAEPEAAEPEATESPAAETGPEPESPAAGSGDAGAESPERVAVSAAPGAPEPERHRTGPAATETPETPPPEQRAPSAMARAERAELARVDAGLLDSLLNSAGEVSIFQSRLNQQVHSIEFHLGELSQTVTRLREQLRNLEAETEAQILHRHQGEAVDDEQFDPLELDRYSTIQQLSRALAETSNDVASINELLQGLTSEADTLLTQQGRVTTDLQDGLMQTRMVTFDRHATRLARIVRQAAQDTGKSAELAIEGSQSQIDRQILEAVVPALEHLLRNAVVHGIETMPARAAAGKPGLGKVVLSVRREGSEVLIEVSDDGGGLDLKAIRRKAEEKGLIREGEAVSDDDIMEMILLPGFSTADELTQAAGRGVGMDVVDNEIKRLGGSLRIDSEAGRGTRFLIRLPYTLAITHALIVNVGEETFALPLPTVEGIARVRREQLLELLTEDDPRLAHGDGSYRLLHLGSLVGSAPSPLPEEEGAVSLVLVRAGESSAALLTDSLEGSREVIVKTLGPHITSVPGVSGATILGDGRVVVILDAGTLVRTQPGEVKPAPPPAAASEPRPLTALVVDDSITMRRVTQRLLERRGVKVHTARDGLDAIEVLRENEADIILLDVEMPRMDGYQFASHVRNDARLRDTPIIMVTSRSGEKHRARAIEIGVNDYLSKPYQEPELVAAIEALVGRKL